MSRKTRALCLGFTALTVRAQFDDLFGDNFGDLDPFGDNFGDLLGGDLLGGDLLGGDLLGDLDDDFNFGSSFKGFGSFDFFGSSVGSYDLWGEFDWGFDMAGSEGSFMWGSFDWGSWDGWDEFDKSFGSFESSILAAEEANWDEAWEAYDACWDMKLVTNDWDVVNEGFDIYDDYYWMYAPDNFYDEMDKCYDKMEDKYISLGGDLGDFYDDTWDDAMDETVTQMMTCVCPDRTNTSNAYCGIDIFPDGDEVWATDGLISEGITYGISLELEDLNEPDYDLIWGCEDKVADKMSNEYDIDFIYELLWEIPFAGYDHVMDSCYYNNDEADSDEAFDSCYRQAESLMMALGSGADDFYFHYDDSMFEEFYDTYDICVDSFLAKGEIDTDSMNFYDLCWETATKEYEEKGGELDDIYLGFEAQQEENKWAIVDKCFEDALDEADDYSSWTDQQWNDLNDQCMSDVYEELYGEDWEENYGYGYMLDDLFEDESMDEWMTCFDKNSRACDMTMNTGFGSIGSWGSSWGSMWDVDWECIDAAYVTCDTQVLDSMKGMMNEEALMLTKETKVNDEAASSYKKCYEKKSKEKKDENGDLTDEQEVSIKNACTDVAVEGIAKLGVLDEDKTDVLVRLETGAKDLAAESVKVCVDQKTSVFTSLSDAKGIYKDCKGVAKVAFIESGGDADMFDVSLRQSTATKLAKEKEACGDREVCHDRLAQVAVALGIPEGDVLRSIQDGVAAQASVNLKACLKAAETKDENTACHTRTSEKLTAMGYTEDEAEYLTEKGIVEEISQVAKICESANEDSSACANKVRKVLKQDGGDQLGSIAAMKEGAKNTAVIVYTACVENSGLESKVAAEEACFTSTKADFTDVLKADASWWDDSEMEAKLTLSKTEVKKDSLNKMTVSVMKDSAFLDEDKLEVIDGATAFFGKLATSGGEYSLFGQQVMDLTIECDGTECEDLKALGRETADGADSLSGNAFVNSLSGSGRRLLQENTYSSESSTSADDVDKDFTRTDSPTSGDPTTDNFNGASSTTPVTFFTVAMAMFLAKVFA